MRISQLINLALFQLIKFHQEWYPSVVGICKYLSWLVWKISLIYYIRDSCVLSFFEIWFGSWCCIMMIFEQWRLLPYKNFGLWSPLSATNVTNDEGWYLMEWIFHFHCFLILFLTSKFQFCWPHHMKYNDQIFSTRSEYL